MESTEKLFDSLKKEDFRKARGHIGDAVQDLMDKRIENAKEAVRQQFSDEYGN